MKACLSSHIGYLHISISSLTHYNNYTSYLTDMLQTWAGTRAAQRGQSGTDHIEIEEEENRLTFGVR